MSDKVAILITNYNMVERCDALCRHITKYVRWPHDLIVVDNGSDLVEPSQFTTLQLPENVQTTGGWLAGLRQAQEIGKHLAYWFLITSAEFVDESDPLTPMMEFLAGSGAASKNTAGIHPALTADSTTSWKHLLTRGGGGFRRTWMIDNIASLYRAAWFDSIGRFDPEMRYAWGIDLEVCYLARKEGRSLWVREGSRIKKVTNIGYQMDRMRMSADERGQLARDNMYAVMTRKYGDDWWQMVTEDYIEDDWR